VNCRSWPTNSAFLRFHSRTREPLLPPAHHQPDLFDTDIGPAGQRIAAPLGARSGAPTTGNQHYRGQPKHPRGFTAGATEFNGARAVIMRS
jgi:hypothetical protein